MIDWNRNGKIDPVDVGISIASGESTDCSEKDDTDISTNPKSIKRSGCLTSCLIFIASTITLKVAWGYIHGVDIEAVKGKQRWLIEVKGPGSRPEMRVNYFIGILGETLQRMDDPDAHYSIAFPDMQAFRSLWAKLPKLAKERTGIDLILIDEKGIPEILK